MTQLGAAIPFYRRLASPLHAARATVSAAWAFALLAATLLCDSPIVLLALLLSVLAASAGARVSGQLLRALRGALIVALPIVLVNVLVFLGIRGMRMRLVAAKAELVGLCPDGERAYGHAFRLTSSAWPVLLALALEAFSGVGLAFSDPGKREGLFLLPLEVLRFLLTLGILSFVWVYATGLLGLYELGKQPLRLKSYREDSLLGTRLIGQLSLRFALSYYVVLLIVLVANSFAGDLSTALTVAVFAIIGIPMFFLPLSSIHRKMAEVKRRELSAVRARFAQIMSGPDGDPPAGGEPLALLERRLRGMTGLQVLDMEIRETANIRTWPFDSRILGQLTVIVLSVAAAMITRLLINALRL